MPGPESLDATQKVGAQAEALGKLIRQRTTSLSQEQTADQVVRPRLGIAELEELNRGRLTSQQLALLLDRCQGKSATEVAAMAAKLGVDASLLQRVLQYHDLPLGLGATTSGQLF